LKDTRRGHTSHLKFGISILLKSKTRVHKLSA
jgi:hypothetical protein